MKEQIESMIQKPLTVESKMSEVDSLLEIARELTNEMLTVSYLFNYCDDLVNEHKVIMHREGITSLIKHLSHDIDDVLDQIGEAARRKGTTRVV
jgi:hypothetical protein